MQEIIILFHLWTFFIRMETATKRKEISYFKWLEEAFMFNFIQKRSFALFEEIVLLCDKACRQVLHKQTYTLPPTPTHPSVLRV